MYEDDQCDATNDEQTGCCDGQTSECEECQADSGEKPAEEPKEEDTNEGGAEDDGAVEQSE